MTAGGWLCRPHMGLSTGGGWAWRSQKGCLRLVGEAPWWPSLGVPASERPWHQVLAWVCQQP